MSRQFFVLLCTIWILKLSAQSPVGAWQGFHTADDGVEIKSVVIFSEGYQVISVYKASTGEFISTNGGTWTLDGSTMTEVVEFDSNNPERVGESVVFDINMTEDHLSIIGSDMKLSRIDSGEPGALHGAWLMSGRVRDGEVQKRDTSRPRKTMKILSGSRFQWIAYNTETKEFKGTGGGTYTTIGGDYTETIQFFSRDDSRVGMSLDFQYELENSNWIHKGLSSKGQPIHEIWSIRK